MAEIPFSDLHCHPTLYAFNRMRSSPELERDRAVFHPWQECASDVKKMESASRGTWYSQANFPKLIEGKVKLAFASFTPIEKGFFIGSGYGDERKFSREVLRWLRGEVALMASFRLLKGDVDGAAREVLGILRNRGPLRKLVQRIVMAYPMKRVQFLASDAYDYWEELLLEYDFLKLGDRQRRQVEIETGEGKKSVQGSYRIVKDSQDLEESFATDDEVALVLTIEGGHVFSVGPKLEILSLEVMKERIKRLKEWEHPVLFLTLAHHFENGLCGHAHSLIDMADWIMDQEQALNEGLDKERGRAVIRELLDLDEENKDRGGKRILIDTRHMSAQSRKEYYEEIIKPYNQWWEKQSKAYQARYPKLPVVMSHCGYTGVATLDELIRDASREGDNWRKGSWYSWNINLCDEDIRITVESEGLIGLCMDRRILGMASGEKVAPEVASQVLIEQIFAIADAVMVDDRLSEAEKARVWDCICLGTDYDGVIQPLEAYPTALDLPQFGKDLRRALKEREHTRQIGAIGVEVILEKIAWRNAYEFAMRHLPAAVGQGLKKQKKEISSEEAVV